jgi:hypothetical protein
MFMKRALFISALLAPNDGAGNGDPSTGGAGSGAKTDPPKVEAPDVAAQLKAANAELAKLKQAETDRANAAAAAQKKAADDQLVAEGKYKQLLEQKDAELASLKPLADLGKAAQADAEKRLNEAKAKLSADDQALVDAAPVTQREALIARLSVAATTTTTSKPNPGTGIPAPGGGAIDFGEALKNGEAAWKAAKARDPEGARKFLQNTSAPDEGPNRPLAHLHRPVPASK